MRMTPERLPLRLMLAPLVAALGILGLLLMPMPQLGYTALETTLRTFLHIPAFATITFLMHIWMNALRSRTDVPLTLLLAVLLVVAVAAELVEASLTSTWSGEDMLNNIVGVFVGRLIWRFTVVHKSKERDWFRKLPHILLAGLCVLVGSLPVGWAAIGLVEQRASFPVLYDPEFSKAPSLVESLGALDEVDLVFSESGTSVKLLKGRFPGIVIWRFLRDWRGYDGLSIELSNPTDDPLEVEVRIRDQSSSPISTQRFNEIISLHPTTRRKFHFALSEIQSGPDTRQIDLSNMMVIAIARVQGKGNTFILHSVSLTRLSRSTLIP